MSKIRIKSLEIENYRSFWEKQSFQFTENNKPTAIVWYNNSWKTNLLNSILYCLNVNFVSKDTFSIDDFHNKDIRKIPQMLLNATSSIERKYNNKKAILEWDHKLEILVDGEKIEGSSIKSFREQYNSNGESEYKENYQAFWATRYFPIFYINFHNIKDEISTKKTSWGNLKSFLAKHIQKIVTEDTDMNNKRLEYESKIKSSTDFILEESSLQEFVEKIKKNYNQNLRDNNIEIDFSLPDYEDIFLQMIFKIGLNGSETNFVPIEHFGDGYISMFVMAVIQSIAEDNDDKCLFLFEEPESFLHENHQEYFYKVVLCTLAEKGHQVIYTTHSDKMINIFDTEWLIRLELEEYDNNWETCFQTIKKYNKTNTFTTDVQAVTEDLETRTLEIVTMDKYNEFIKTIEPNLNRILFSKKVLLVEWPNDVLVYKYCIENMVEEKIRRRTDIADKKRYAETYLNFHNISIIPHHWKATAIYLMEVCKWFWLDYFIINDWDFGSTDLSIEELKSFQSLEEMRSNPIYTNSDKKGMVTTNYNLLKNAHEDNIHFNVPKLEDVTWYCSEDKSSVRIYNYMTRNNFNYKNEKLFPTSLVKFLEIDKISEESE